MVRHLAVALLSLALLFSGCSGGSAPTEIESTTSAQPVPTVDEETGSLAGVVLTEELSPIKGATVAVDNAKTSTTTDDAGAFTFNGLLPGSYNVFAQMLGFSESARKVEIMAGNVTEVRFTLVAIPLEEEGFHVSLPRTSFVQAGNGLVGGAVQFIVPVNTSAAWSSLCSGCSYRLFVDANPVQVMTEVVWATPTVPSTNELIEYWYFFQNGTTYLDRPYEDLYLSNREKGTWTEESVTRMKKVRELGVEVIPDETGVSFQHRVEAWATFAYGQALPDDFSALPPT